MFCASCTSNFGTVALTELGCGEVSVIEVPIGGPRKCRAPAGSYTRGLPGGSKSYLFPLTRYRAKDGFVVR